MEGTFGICRIHLRHLQGYPNNKSINIRTSSIIQCSSSTLDMVSNIRRCSPSRIRYLLPQLSSLFTKILDHLVAYLGLLIDLEEVADLTVGMVTPIFIKE
jgi:hypothetical protein